MYKKKEHLIKLKSVFSLVIFLASSLAISASDQPMTGLFMGGFPEQVGVRATVNKIDVDGLRGFKSYTCYANDLKGLPVARQVSITDSVAEARREFFKAHLASGVKLDVDSKKLYIKLETQDQPVTVSRVVCDESSEEAIIERYTEDKPY